MPSKSKDRFVNCIKKTHKPYLALGRNTEPECGTRHIFYGIITRWKVWKKAHGSCDSLTADQYRRYIAEATAAACGQAGEHG